MARNEYTAAATATTKKNTTPTRHKYSRIVAALGIDPVRGLAGRG